MLRDLGEIAEAIVTQLGRTRANVTISVEKKPLQRTAFLTTSVGRSARAPAL